MLEAQLTTLNSAVQRAENMFDRTLQLSVTGANSASTGSDLAESKSDKAYKEAAHVVKTSLSTIASVCAEIGRTYNGVNLELLDRTGPAADKIGVRPMSAPRLGVTSPIRPERPKTALLHSGKIEDRPKSPNMFASMQRSPEAGIAKRLKEEEKRIKRKAKKQRQRQKCLEEQEIKIEEEAKKIVQQANNGEKRTNGPVGSVSASKSGYTEDFEEEFDSYAEEIGEEDADEVESIMPDESAIKSSASRMYQGGNQSAVDTEGGYSSDFAPAESAILSRENSIRSGIVDEINSIADDYEEDIIHSEAPSRNGSFKRESGSIRDESGSLKKESGSAGYEDDFVSDADERQTKDNSEYEDNVGIAAMDKTKKKKKLSLPKYDLVDFKETTLNKKLLLESLLAENKAKKTKRSAIEKGELKEESGKGMKLFQEVRDNKEVVIEKAKSMEDLDTLKRSKTMSRKEIHSILKTEQWNPLPCSYCYNPFLGEGKYFPSTLTKDEEIIDKVNQKLMKKYPKLYRRNPSKRSLQPTDGEEDDLDPPEVIFLKKLRDKKSLDSIKKPFCSWECLKKWTVAYCPLQHKYQKEILVDIAAGYHVEV